MFIMFIIIIFVVLAIISYIINFTYCWYTIFKYYKPDDNGDVKDVLKNYRAVTQDNALAFNHTYIIDKKCIRNIIANMESLH